MVAKKVTLAAAVCLLTFLSASSAFAADPASFDWEDPSVLPHESIYTLTNGTISITSYYYSYLHLLQYDGTDFMDYPTAGGESYALRYTSSTGTNLVGWFQGTVNYIQDWTQIDAYSIYEIDETPDGLLQVRVDVSVPTTGKYFYIVYSVTNMSASETLTDVQFYQYVEPNADHSNTETTAYDSVRSMIYSYNEGQPYMGTAICSPADEFDISNFWTAPNGVLAHIVADALNNNPGPYSGDTGFALKWDMGALEPGEAFVKTLIFAVDDNLSALQQTMDDALATVDPSECQLACYDFYGFIEPLPFEGSADVRTFKSKRVIPVKFRLYDALGNEITILTEPPVISVLYSASSTPGGDVEDYDVTGKSDDGNTFRYSDGNWIFNLSMRSFAINSDYDIVVTIPETGCTHQVTIKLVK